MLVFGHYGFPIKTIRPGKDHPEVESIQLIVRVFHLFYIPIFPYTKIWTVNKQGQRFRIEGSSALECERLYGSPAYPFYAFAGVILIALIPICFGLNGMMKNAKQEQFVMEEKMRNQSLFIETLSKVTPSEMLIFTNKEHKYLCAKVIANEGDNLHLAIPKEVSDAQWKDNNWIMEYFENENNYETVIQTRASIIHAIDPGTYELEASRKLSLWRHTDLMLIGVKSLLEK